MTCLHCGRPFDPVRFPLARPRKDGTRHPFRYCDSCLALPMRRGGGHHAVLEAHRGYRARERSAFYAEQVRRRRVAVERTRMWKAKLRADVEAVRASRNSFITPFADTTAERTLAA